MTIAALGSELNDIKGLAGSGSTRVVQAIKTAAQKTGVDFAYLMQKAETESSLNPSAQAKGSSARGLYQFTGSTWLDTLDKHADKYGLGDIASAIGRKNGVAYVADPAKRKEIMALRDNPELSACMAGELANDNAACLKAKTGGAVGGTELYLAHFLGAGGAGQLLKKIDSNPNTPAASILPQAAAANHNIFYTDGGRARTVKEVYDHFAAKFDGTGGVNATASAGASTPDATIIAQAIAPIQAGSKNGFDAFTGGYEATGNSGVNTSIAMYQQVSDSQMSADGKVYSMGGDTGQSHQEQLFYQLWLADQSKRVGGI